MPPLASYGSHPSCIIKGNGICIKQQQCLEEVYLFICFYLFGHGEADPESLVANYKAFDLRGLKMCNYNLGRKLGKCLTIKNSGIEML